MNKESENMTRRKICFIDDEMVLCPDAFPVPINLLSTHESGKSTPLTTQETIDALDDAWSKWRENNSPVYGMRAAWMFLKTKTQMPNDLQDWLGNGIERSIATNGEITLDAAFGIIRRERKLNAYNELEVNEEQRLCVGLMKVLVEATGVDNKALISRIVCQVRQPSFEPTSLVDYYRKTYASIGSLELMTNEQRLEIVQMFPPDRLFDKEREFIIQQIELIQARID